MYNEGYSDGKYDALNSGLYGDMDHISTAGGFTGKDKDHYVTGYNEGYHDWCAASKYIDACGGNAPGTIK